MTQTARDYPSTGLIDLLRLLGRCAGSFASGPRSFDFGLTLRDWFRDLVGRTESENVVLNLYFKRFLVVTGRELSEHILAQPPDVRGYVEGSTKAQAMSFLAPQALTVTHGEQWQRLRRFNEAALQADEADARMQFILDGVGGAFSGPVSDIGDIRRCMAQTMLAVVLGAGQDPGHLAEDVQRLFGYVQNPGRRILFGWSQRGRRKRLYHELRRLWGEMPAPGAPSLVATAKGMAHDARFAEKELIQQIPHWMFTFTGSGADLLARTLGVVASRHEVHERARAEALEQGSTGRASSMMKMRYLESCLLETCRLFPPVTRTFHVAPRGDTFGGVRIPAGLEILHFFTASHRDLSVDATADDFRPERWMAPGSSARAIYPRLFLGGARDCPGRDLILFVCKAAMSVLLQRGLVRSECAALSKDPMPLSFPESGLRFGTEERP